LSRAEFDLKDLMWTALQPW